MSKRKNSVPALLTGLLPALVFLVCQLFPGTSAQAQTSLGAVQNQIRLYGCNLPQYANSNPDCIRLHARARALRSGSQNRPYYPARPSYVARPQPYSSGGFGSLFGGLFGGTSSRPSYGYNNGTYGGYGNGSNYAYSPAWRNTGGYRTICVRTCDGFYFPISTSTSRSGISRDAQTCQNSCGAPARLFYQYGLGSNVANAVDLQGNRYSSLENAFRYREEYVADCRCKPDPWSEAAKEEYQRRAEAEEAGEAGPVKTAENAGDGQTMTDVPLGAGVDAVAPQPVVRSRPRRKRYGADYNKLEGRWWAGSW